MNTPQERFPDPWINPQWMWPCGRVGYRPEDLFKSLHDRFNMVPTRLQSMEAFRHDCADCAEQASSQDEFHELLGERQKQRLRELKSALDSLAMGLAVRPDRTPEGVWEACLPFWADRSIDGIVRIFDYFDKAKPIEKATPAQDAIAAMPPILSGPMLLPPLHEGHDGHDGRVGRDGRDGHDGREGREGRQGRQGHEGRQGHGGHAMPENPPADAALDSDAKSSLAPPHRRRCPERRTGHPDKKAGGRGGTRRGEKDTTTGRGQQDATASGEAAEWGCATAGDEAAEWGCATGSDEAAEQRCCKYYLYM